MSTSAPSRAKAIATAFPMPESPPVIIAALPVNRFLPRYDCSPWSAWGFIALSVPGTSCGVFGNGGFGYLFAGSWPVFCTLSLLVVIGAMVYCVFYGIYFNFIRYILIGLTIRRAVGLRFFKHLAIPIVI